MTAAESQTSEHEGSAVKYDGVAKTLHWLIAVLVLLMLVGGFNLDDSSKPVIEENIRGHSGIGLTVLVLMLIRLWWRLRHPAPAMPEDMPRWQARAARGVHYAFYALVTLQPVIGIGLASAVDFEVRAFGLLGVSGIVPQSEAREDLFHELHEINAFLIIVLIAVHSLAALYHHLVRKDAVLRRMLPFART